jgi:hypothetical protein
VLLYLPGHGWRVGEDREAAAGLRDGSLAGACVLVLRLSATTWRARAMEAPGCPDQPKQWGEQPQLTARASSGTIAWGEPREFREPPRRSHAHPNVISRRVTPKSLMCGYGGGEKVPEFPEVPAKLMRAVSWRSCSRRRCRHHHVLRPGDHPAGRHPRPRPAARANARLAAFWSPGGIMRS